ncbi:MAG: hypothetical protein ACU83V_07995 [Gammaproteobacteria bacterium]
MLKIFKAFKTQVTAFINARQPRIAKKTIYIAITLVFVALFGDSLLLFVKKFLHVLVEIIESVMEHFLQSAFQVTPRQAEMIVFWIDVLLASVLLWFVIGKAHDWTVKACAAGLEKWRSKPKSEKWIILFWVSVIFGSLFKIGLLLFT